MYDYFFFSFSRRPVQGRTADRTASGPTITVLRLRPFPLRWCRVTTVDTYRRRPRSSRLRRRLCRPRLPANPERSTRGPVERIISTVTRASTAATTAGSATIHRPRPRSTTPTTRTPGQCGSPRHHYRTINCCCGYDRRFRDFDSIRRVHTLLYVHVYELRNDQLQSVKV